MRGEVTSSIEILTLVDCANVSDGGMLHCLAKKTGLCDSVLITSLLSLYAKCGAPEISAQLFRDIPHRTSITWSAMMSGFTQNGSFRDAIELFQQMLASGHVQPNHDIIIKHPLYNMLGKYGLVFPKLTNVTIHMNSNSQRKYPTKH